MFLLGGGGGGGGGGGCVCVFYISVFSIYLCSICLLKYSSAASYCKLPLRSVTIIELFIMGNKIPDVKTECAH